MAGSPDPFPLRVPSSLDVAGAGDQGMMFGYACDETPELMPLPITLAHRLASSSPTSGKSGCCPSCAPTARPRCRCATMDGRPVEVEKLLISTQHAEGAEARSAETSRENVIRPVHPGRHVRRDSCQEFLVNPTGRFVIGGPMGDAGLTGRKIIVDTYGGMARHGGGAFSGKDPSKVDRSAAYAARWVAKNVVAAGLADRAEVQVAYAIGVAHPVSVMVETFGTEQDRPRHDRRAGQRALRPAPGRLPRGAQAAPADLPEDRRLRPLRPRRPGLHLGEHGQGCRAANAAASPPATA